MGANQSYETDVGDVTTTSTSVSSSRRHHGDRTTEGRGRHGDGGNGQASGDRLARQQQQHVDGGRQRRKKVKPEAPHRPVVTSVTHNAVSLTWLPPRHSLHAIIAYTLETRRPRQSKHWVTLTKNCQGTHYEARHLNPNAEYIFRVRAENIYGTGKPSAPSEIVTTKIFEMSSDLNCYLSHNNTTTTTSPLSPAACTPDARGFPKSYSYEGGLLESSDSVFDVSGGSVGMIKSPSLPVSGDRSFSSSSSIRSHNPPSVDNNIINQKQYGSFRRRHSFNVQLDGRVSMILNHSDRFYSSSSLNSSTSTIVTRHHSNSSNNNNNNNGSLSSINDNNDTDSVKTRTRSRSGGGGFLRSNTHRTSLLQPGRKYSVPILLPGTGSNSLNRLRESRASLHKSVSISNDVTGNPCATANGMTSYVQRKRGSVCKVGKSKEFRNSLSSTASDSTNMTSSTTSSSSSSSKEDNSNTKTGQGSRLSLQSVISDVTMSNQSQSSEDTNSSRPLSFLSDLGDHTVLGSFLNGSGMKDFSKIFDDDNGFDDGIEDNTTIKDDNYNDNDNRVNVNKVVDVNDDDDDDILRLKRDLKNMELTEEKLKYYDLKESLRLQMVDETSCLNNNLNQKEYYQTLDNPWQRDSSSLNSVSENIMAAPFSDDIKIALNAKNKNNANDVIGYAYRSANRWGEVDGNDSNGRDDFRTLRSVLQSNHVIVKQSRSLPEVMGVVLGEGGETRTLTRGALTTIEDEDEGEEAVRVTTL